MFLEFFGVLWLRITAFLKLYIIGAIYSVRELFWRGKCTTRFVADCNKPIAILTGGYGSIGIAVAKRLINAGYCVVLIGKNGKKGEAAVNELNSQQVSFICADLSSKNQLKNLSLHLKTKFKKIHLLIHCAGVMLLPYQETKNGREMHFAVNYFAHVYLSLELLDRLESSYEPNRWTPKIIVLTSATLFAGNLKRFLAVNFDRIHQNVSPRHQYSSHAAYADSKLASAVFVHVLAQKLAKVDSKVSVASLHPGVIPTNLYRHVWRPFQFLIRVFPGPWILRGPEDAAEDVLKVCAEENGRGEYWEHGKECGIKRLYEPWDGDSLWEETMKLWPGPGPDYMN